ncbi:hypothetical protein BZM27_55280, partial [Paraburkholderia steynii]
MLNEIPKALWGLVEGYGMWRKVILTKKDLLFCLAGLMAENIYHARARNKPKRKDGTPVKTLEDCYLLTVELLASHGFTYSAATLKKEEHGFAASIWRKSPRYWIYTQQLGRTTWNKIEPQCRMSLVADCRLSPGQALPRTSGGHDP